MGVLRGTGCEAWNLLLACAVASRALGWATEEMLDFSGSSALRTSWSGSEIKSEQTTAAGGTCVCCTLVTEAILDIPETAAVFASVKYCHTYHLLKDLDRET